MNAKVLGWECVSYLGRNKACVAEAERRGERGEGQIT